MEDLPEKNIFKRLLNYFKTHRLIFVATIIITFSLILVSSSMLVGSEKLTSETQNQSLLSRIGSFLGFPNQDIDSEAVTETVGEQAEDCSVYNTPANRTHNYSIIYKTLSEECKTSLDISLGAKYLECDQQPMQSAECDYYCLRGYLRESPYCKNNTPVNNTSVKTQINNCSLCKTNEECVSDENQNYFCRAKTCDTTICKANEVCVDLPSQSIAGYKGPECKPKTCAGLNCEAEGKVCVNLPSESNYSGARCVDDATKPSQGAPATSTTTTTTTTGSNTSTSTVDPKKICIYSQTANDCYSGIQTSPSKCEYEASVSKRLNLANSCDYAKICYYSQGDKCYVGRCTGNNCTTKGFNENDCKYDSGLGQEIDCSFAGKAANTTTSTSSSGTGSSSSDLLAIEITVNGKSLEEITDPDFSSGSLIREIKLNDVDPDPGDKISFCVKYIYKDNRVVSPVCTQQYTYKPSGLTN